jgi:capsular polysaccharide biosynthesis protein/MinD-like ATPase involved in chromosome partitioning or flagellar assembly
VSTGPQSTAESESLPRSVQRYTGVLRRQWWVIVLTTAIALAAAVVYVETATPVYSASSKVVVGQGESLFNPALSVNDTAVTSTISSLLQSNVVAEDAIKQLGLHMTPTQLLSNLSVKAQPTGAVIDVSYNDPDQARAVRILGTLGSIFANLVNTELGSRSKSNGAAPRTAAGTVVTQPVSAVVFDPAHANPGQVSPHKARTGVIALVLGLVAGIVLAFLRDALSSTIKSEEDAAAAYGTTSLGSLPRGSLGLAINQVGALPRKTRVRMSEAFQMVAVRLRYTTGTERGVIVVASARPEDGKTTLSAHIAAELAAAGNDVIAVEADLHRPALHRLFGVDPSPPDKADVSATGGALATSLIDIDTSAPHEEATRPRRAVLAGRRGGNPESQPGGNGAPEPAATSPIGGGRLRLLPAEVTRAQGNALSLASASLLVDRLRALADYVVVDTPPLLLSGDAYPLIQRADAVVVACRRGATRHSEALRARDILQSLGVRDFSVVFTESDLTGRDYYGYESS